MTKVSRTLRSPRLAFVLCILLAFQAALGTLTRPGETERLARDHLGEAGLAVAKILGLVDTYGSPLFLVLLSLLSLSIGFCTWQRLSLACRAPSRRGPAAALDALMHFSFIALLAGGALKGALGFVGTQYLVSGEVATTAHAGGTGPETPLGFGLLLKELVKDYYPTTFKIGVRDARSGESIAVLTIREGGEGALPGAGLRLSVGSSDPEGRWAKVRATAGEAMEEILLETVPGGATAGRFADFEIVMIAWRRELRTIRGRVAVIDGGTEVREAWLAVGGRIAHRGTSVFLTAWGEDEYRNPYLGVQVSRDPGAPLFWGGAVLLAAAMPLFLIVRRTGGRGVV